MMTGFRMLFVAGLVLLCGCVAGHAPPHPNTLEFAELGFDLPKIDRFRLDSGVRFFLQEDQELPLVTITIMFEGGSICDPQGKSGLASLHASALRGGGAGDRRALDVDQALEGIAADLSITADTYATLLRFSVQSSDLAEGMGIIADVLRHPRFDADGVALARERFLENLRREHDQPALVARKALISTLYQGHVLGELPSSKSVSAIRREDLLAYHQNVFMPGNMWMAVSGDIDRTSLSALLSPLLEDWRNHAKPPLFAVEPLPAAPSPCVMLVPKDLPQTTVVLGQRGIDKGDPDLYALRVADFILGSGNFNSRLMQEIRTRRGLAYSVYSQFQVGRRLPGLFVAGAETRNASVAEVVRLMRREMESLRKERVSADELALAKESLINSFVFGFADSHEVVSQSMRLAFYGYPEDYLVRYRDRIAAVDADAVLEVAQRRLLPGQQTLFLVGNPDRPDLLSDQLGMPLKTISPP
ncbi:M16 family metallopeptidase [Syntrophotalea acetylenica]|nr:pitrilysin family protein [Syntrophotalea acetylenica]APG44167.1 hypothetical protein A6070_08645 [Syntrophotalea acetylenica]